MKIVVLVDISTNTLDRYGRQYRVVVYIEEANRTEQYPEGVKALYKLFRLNNESSEELVILMDNHEPFGFHKHHKLPRDKYQRRSLGTKDWKEVWQIFQERCKEKFNAP